MYRIRPYCSSGKNSSVNRNAVVLQSVLCAVHLQSCIPTSPRCAAIPVNGIMVPWLLLQSVRVMGKCPCPSYLYMGSGHPDYHPHT